MTAAIPKPPPVIDYARVLKYAVLDESVKFSGRTLIFVNGRELGPAPCLAICQNLEDAAILLFHCDRDWTVLGVAGFESIAAAEQRAEKTYPGISRAWKDPGFTTEDTAKYLEELAGEERCSFCGRSSAEADVLLEKNGKWICDVCTTEFNKMLLDHGHDHSN